MPLSVTLDEMLNAREHRCEIQNTLLNKTNVPLVCLTMNIPGPIKRTPAVKWLFFEGVKSIEKWPFKIVCKQILDQHTGCEAFFSVDAPPETIKEHAVILEDSFPYARLFDVDVLDTLGEKLSREGSRKCLVCSENAQGCSRSRAHGLDTVTNAVSLLLKSFCGDKLGELAYQSLLSELYTTPKPGLVDKANNGSHKDLNVPLFEKSAKALIPYFSKIANLGWDKASMEQLRIAGIDGEEIMFRATNGVNTHKGMVYSMGLIISAASKMLSDANTVEYSGFKLETVLSKASQSAGQDAEKMLLKAKSTPKTNGNKVYAQYGAKGAVWEAFNGFPNGLFAFQRLDYYKKLNAQNPEALTLLDLMCRLEDTNLLHRGGLEGLRFVRESAQKINSYPIEKRIDLLEKMDTQLIMRNLSPGGSADMLALGIFLRDLNKIFTRLFAV